MRQENLGCLSHLSDFQLGFLPIAGSVCFVALNIPWTMSSLMTRLSGSRGLAMSTVVGRMTFAGACASEGGGSACR